MNRKMLERPKWLFRYRSIRNQDDWKKTELDSILTKGIFISSSIGRMNDLFECPLNLLFTDYEKAKEVVKTIEREYNANYVDWMRFYPQYGGDKFPNKLMQEVLRLHYSIISFSADRKNPVMWGHYADSGKGICIEARNTEWNEKTDALSKGSFAQIDGSGSFVTHPIQYMKDEIRPTLEAWKFFKGISGEFDSAPYANEFVTKAFLVKSGDWQYEKEYRAVVTSGEGGELYMPVERVFLGPLIGEREAGEIIGKYPNIKFIRTRLSESKFEVIANEDSLPPSKQ